MSVVVWADIPVVDPERASTFSARVLDVPVTSPPGMEGHVALIMVEAPSADLALNSGSAPTTTAGTTVCFGANCDTDGMLARVVEAGG